MRSVGFVVGPAGFGLAVSDYCMRFAGGHCSIATRTWSEARYVTPIAIWPSAVQLAGRPKCPYPRNRRRQVPASSASPAGALLKSPSGRCSLPDQAVPLTQAEITDRRGSDPVPLSRNVSPAMPVQREDHRICSQAERGSTLPRRTCSALLANVPVT
jgi:hypothetical protein